MTKKSAGLVVIHVTKLTAKTKAARKRQFERILQEGNRICAAMDGKRNAPGTT